MLAGGKIKLTKPIKTPDGEVTELTLSEPTLGALEDIELLVERRADGSLGLRLDLGMIARLVAGLCAIPVASAKQIRLQDLGEVIQQVMGFFGESPGTGGS